MTVTINTKQGPKQYTMVAERLTALHEAGKTLEVLESAPVAVGNSLIWRVLIKVDGLTYVGNAEVHLNSNNPAEKADPFATAETSAVGRALAWCGYAGTPDNPSIASADEIVRGHSGVATEQQLATIRKLCEHLHKAVPIVANSDEAKDWIARLGKAYRERAAVAAK